MVRFLFLVILITLNFPLTKGQPVPAEDENIPYLMTFGPKAEISWGDDDFSQTFFFAVPKDFTQPIYIKIFDPEVGGKMDELNGEFDTRMSYQVYGGKGAYSNKDAQGIDPKGNYKSGTLLGTKSFLNDPQYDQKWFVFGPFDPKQGEYIEMFDANIFKVICEGVAGDDGNTYNYFMSSSKDQNIRIPSGNAFAYEYSFRMWDDPKEVSHIYPYVDNATIALKQSNFDWDDDGYIEVISRVVASRKLKVSGDNEWIETEFSIREEEKKSSLDFQFHKKPGAGVKNNNVVIYVMNQRNELIPFFTVPIGGVPKFIANTGGGME